MYGYTYYELVTTDRQLPIVVHIASANRHDSVLSLYTTEEAYERNFSLKYASFDSASDAYGIYELGIKHWDVGLIIPLNETNKGNYTYPPPIEITEAGVPKCQANLEMTNWGFCRDRCRIKWRCPVKATSEYQDFDCPKVSECSDSQYGRVIYTKPEWDYRIHTPVPRESKLTKSLENQRSASERSNKRKKYDFLLLNTRTSGRKFWFFRVILASMCQHIDEWYKEQNKEAAEEKAKIFHSTHPHGITLSIFSSKETFFPSITTQGLIFIKIQRILLVSFSRFPVFSFSFVNWDNFLYIHRLSEISP